MCVLYLSALVSEELPGVVDDLFVRQVGVRLLLTHTQHLPQSDAERPHVAGRGELSLGSQQMLDVRNTSQDQNDVLCKFLLRCKKTKWKQA